MSIEDFDNADLYLLESRFSDGTRGGDSGVRRLTSTGVDFLGTQGKQEVTSEAVTPPLHRCRTDCDKNQGYMQTSTLKQIEARS